MKRLILFVFLSLVLGSCTAGGPESDLVRSTADAEAFATVLAEPEPTATPTATPVPPTPTPVPDEVYTGVILGTDWDPRRPERNMFGIRSDVFVIYSFVVRPGVGVIDLDFFSLPRDLWIPVPCSPLDPSLNGYDRINAAYAYGRFECVKDTVELLGFDVNAPIFALNMRGFVSLIDKMGGITITPAITYSDKCGNFQGTEGGDYGWRTWKEGVEYEMDGNLALCYARARMGAVHGDVDRNRRHLEIITAMINQFPERIFDSDDRLDAVAELMGVWTWASTYVETDLTIVDIVKFGGYGIDMLNGDIPYLVHRLEIDALEYYRTPIYNASVLLPRVDVEEWMSCVMNDHEGLRDCVEENLLEGD